MTFSANAPPLVRSTDKAGITAQINYAEFRMRRPVDIAELSYWTGYKAGLEWVLSGTVGS